MKFGSALLTALFTMKSVHGFTTPPTLHTFLPRTHTSSSSLIVLRVQEEVELVTMDVEDRMGKTLESVKRNLDTIRTGRANASLLDRVMVDYYGAPTALNQLAGVSVSSAQQLTVSPYDKGSVGDIERAILESDLGLTPNNDGSGLLRINIPSLTEERRKDLLKLCGTVAEEGRVGLRNVRRDGVASIKKMEKNKEIGEDESLDAQDEIQKMTDKKVKEIEEIVKKKEKDVMTV